MVELIFTYVLPKSSLLYRGSSVPEEGPSFNRYSWYSTTEEHAKNYGHLIKQYTTKKTMHLVNVQSLMFQIHFQDKINELYPKLNKEKIMSLAALGLPSLTAQQSMLTNQPGVCDSDTLEARKLKGLAEFFGSKHRYSFNIGEVKVDHFLVTALTEIYGDRFDGYISPHEWPSCFHNGMFQPEICIFKPRYNVELGKPIATRGGGSETANKQSPNTPKTPKYMEQRIGMTREELNAVMIEKLKSEDWTHIIYDADGYVRFPPTSEIIKVRHLKIPANATKKHRAEILAIRKKAGVLTPGVDLDYWDHVKYNAPRVHTD